MDRGIINTILRGYGVHGRVLAPQAGYRNRAYPVEVGDSQKLNLIIYKHEPGMLARIRQAHRVADFAASRGLPARMTYTHTIAKLQSGNRVQFAALYYFLPGDTIPWEAYTQAHIKHLGAALGTLHAALRTLPRDDLPSVTAENAALLQRMERYFNRDDIKTAMSHKLGLKPRLPDFRPLLRYCEKLDTQQPLHLDFVRGNILFAGHEVTGMLDFEKTAWGHPIFDIARTLAFLLVDCKYKEPRQIRSYFLRSGYVKRGGGRLGYANLLEPLVAFYMLHDFYKFLRHNPYESLSSNEHFTRTKTMLLKRGLIAPC